MAPAGFDVEELDEFVAGVAHPAFGIAQRELQHRASGLLPDEIREAIEAQEHGHSKANVLYASNGPAYLRNMLRTGTATVLIVANLAEPCVRQYLQDARTHGVMTIVLRPRNDKWGKTMNAAVPHRPVIGHIALGAYARASAR